MERHQQLHLPAQPAPAPLRPLPTGLLLLTLSLAASGRASALLPALSQQPQPNHPDSQSRYAQNWNAYVTHRSEALAYAYGAVEASASEGGGSASVRVGLRARGLVVELLTGTRIDSDLREAERVIAKALSVATSHASLFSFQLAFLSHQASIALSSSTPNPKFARTTIKRALGLLDNPPQSLAASSRRASAEDYPQWRYHFLIQLAQVASPAEGATDYATAFLAWRDIEQLASQRGDSQLAALAQLSLAKLAVQRNDQHASELTESLVAALGVTLGFAAEDLLDGRGESEVERQARAARSRDRLEAGRKLLPGTLRVQAALVYCLWRAQEGRTRPDGGAVEGATVEAKARLKEVHRWLDEKRAPGEGEVAYRTRREAEEAGHARIAIHPAPSHPDAVTLIASSLPTPSSVTVLIPPRSLVYRFAFLASLAVYRDPFGAKPKSVAFAAEGLKMVDNSLAGVDKLPPRLSPVNVRPHLRALASLRLSLLLHAAEIGLLRSQFAQVEDSLHEAIATAREHGLWQAVAPRVLLIEGMLAQARGDLKRAFEVLAAVESGKAGKDNNAALGARLALLMLGMSEGLPIRIDSTSRGATSTLGPERKKARLELDDLARKFVDEASQGPPSWRLAAEFVSAMSRGEITKTKEHLAAALALANQGGANHAKALMLALLANLYLHTRNDQAQKMLLASFSIAQGLGARVDRRSAQQREEDKARGRLGDDVVGAARLGLWCGERLVETYENQGEARKALIQGEVNVAHRRVLERETVRQGA